ncbi:hypothetical protein LEN26_012351 [Aphanomyces euteiches]|uniref:Uncharacterized protein n=1 Tax=Aphanomyces euteiches TaxID=100861 RepID=A0A6G0XGJ4_9STRA|nr:hypothetical protein Ae201684_004990 [Aphanomyces euteiches]KAH9082469.1 hypothetical protein Ae201684P_009793 [Aphanomyces euteiches]KAH9107866.1 hypothetical protein AeMF1_016867 [Aphanomyces euteiches]KAH9117906.1 hypothetical protein LEN26_012351 [Aphanomyces euteiches]KAH9139097.1 hypothetical protein AeRB84_016608 [Aphanomyces euteiches]
MSSSVTYEPASNNLTEDDCVRLYKIYSSSDKLPSACKDLLQRKKSGTTGYYGVAENHSLNVKGGHRGKRGDGESHASLQRRFTGPMSGYGKQ